MWYILEFSRFAQRSYIIGEMDGSTVGANVVFQGAQKGSPWCITKMICIASCELRDTRPVPFLPPRCTVIGAAEPTHSHTVSALGCVCV